MRSNGPWRPPAFVGTDTGVGKTTAAVAFQRFLEPRFGFVPIVKPYVSGEINGCWNDLDQSCLPREWWTPARYRRPLSPLGAVRLGERLVPLADVKEYLGAVRREHPRHIIEGIGGVAVPLEERLVWADLHAEEGWPAVIVARGGLGTINHALLTIEALQRRKIPIAGILFSDEAPETRSATMENASIVKDFTDIDSLGIVSYDAVHPVSAWMRDVDWSRLEESLGEH